MNTLTEAVAAIDRALRLDAGRLDLFDGYDITKNNAGYTFMATKGVDEEVAFAQAPTLTDALIILAGQLENAGYKAGAVAAS